jgi:hypothetical protein
MRARELFEDNVGNIVPGDYVFRLYGGTGVDDLQGKIIKRVVTCRECKFLEFKSFYGICEVGYMGIVHPWDYCSRGERRE